MPAQKKGAPLPVATVLVRGVRLVPVPQTAVVVVTVLLVTALPFLLVPPQLVLPQLARPGLVLLQPALPQLESLQRVTVPRRPIMVRLAQHLIAIVAQSVAVSLPAPAHLPKS